MEPKKGSESKKDAWGVEQLHTLFLSLPHPGILGNTLWNTTQMDLYKYGGDGGKGTRLAREKTVLCSLPNNPM